MLPDRLAYCVDIRGDNQRLGYRVAYWTTAVAVRFRSLVRPLLYRLSYSVRDAMQCRPVIRYESRRYSRI